jgi:hypothetical protein
MTPTFLSAWPPKSGTSAPASTGTEIPSHAKLANPTAWAPKRQEGAKPEQLSATNEQN